MVSFISRNSRNENRSQSYGLGFVQILALFEFRVITWLSHNKRFMATANRLRSLLFHPDIDWIKLNTVKVISKPL